MQEYAALQWQLTVLMGPSEASLWRHSAEEMRHGPDCHERVHHIVSDPRPCRLMPLHNVRNHLHTTRSLIHQTRSLIQELS
jgi:hypothetical protein